MDHKQWSVFPIEDLAAGQGKQEDKSPVFPLCR
ncbi:hypothetical protein BS78_02G111400 [Paspalum vaginatum]|nr:hypothetical protein BS78_02G111400 [Paspalum vaginatum]